MNHTHKTSLLWKITCLAVLLWILFIWGNSVLPAAKSSSISHSVLSLVEPLLRMLHIPTASAHTVLRKLGHMTEFALLGLLWSALLHQVALPGRYSRLLGAGGLCLLIALTDETIQLFSPGRGSQVSDVWIDLGGACLGIAAAYLIRRLWISVSKKHGA